MVIIASRASVKFSDTGYLVSSMRALRLLQLAKERFPEKHVEVRAIFFASIL